MLVLSLIAKQLSNKQLSNYDFEKRKYLKGEILKARSFRKFYVILTPFEEVYQTLFLLVSFQMFSLVKFFGK